MWGGCACPIVGRRVRVRGSAGAIAEGPPSTPSPAASSAKAAAATSVHSAETETASPRAPASPTGATARPAGHQIELLLLLLNVETMLIVKQQRLKLIISC